MDVDGNGRDVRYMVIIHSKKTKIYGNWMLWIEMRYMDHELNGNGMNDCM